MKRHTAFLGIICLGSFSFHSDRAAVGAVIGTFGPVTIEARHMPTPELPGFTTWTLSASSNLAIRGFDFAGERGSQLGDPLGYGFFGPINQVNPAGQVTVFGDDFPEIRVVVERDSHLLIRAADVVVPPGFRSESATSLRAIFASPVPLQNPVDFAQLVISHGAQAPVQFRGLVAVGPIENLQEITLFGTIPPIPEPASILLAGFALVVAVSVHRCRGMRARY
jgi:hypothetical protein